ncbi:MAG: hypothetical protein R3Y21_03180 [Mycoplasmatota bacterium]
MDYDKFAVFINAVNSGKKEKKSQAFYFDSENNITTKEKATSVIIREIDENGNVTNETFATIKDNENSENDIEEHKKIK